MAFFTNLPRIIGAWHFSQIHSNSKEVSYLSWKNTYPNLQTTCHIKLKFFLWTKLLGNLLLAKYLITVAAPLKWESFLVAISFPWLFFRFLMVFFYLLWPNTKPPFRQMYWAKPKVFWLRFWQNWSSRL